MNRADRRRQERESRKNSENKVLKRYTQEEFGQLLYDTEFSARAHATEMMIVAYSLANHRLYGHGRTRTKRTYEYVGKLMQDLSDGKLTYKELKEECAKETGINFYF